MNAWVSLLIGVVGGLLLLYLTLVATLWIAHRRDPETIRMKDALRLLPDLLRLLRGLTKDRSLPAGVRIRLTLLLVYLASPIDLIPDFVPVLGYADDVLIVALVLRSTVRSAGTAALDRHWAGTPEGLATIKRLAGVS